MPRDSMRHDERRAVMAQIIWEAAYPHIPWPKRHSGWTVANIWGAAETVLAILDRGPGPIERLEPILQEVLWRNGVNNPLSGAARLVDGPLARWAA